MTFIISKIDLDAQTRISDGGGSDQINRITTEHSRVHLLARWLSGEQNLLLCVSSISRYSVLLT